ncbi:MAG: hypothetical protein ACRBB3_07790 [Alphaproteobacteria bacterium]
MSTRVIDCFDDNIRNYIISNLSPYISGNQKQVIEQEHIKQLTLRYINWTDRLISLKSKSVLMSKELQESPEFLKFSDAIWEIYRKFTIGENLKAYLSRRIVQKAISLNNTSQSADKDGMLNEWGFHHLHLGTQLENDGFIQRTNELLFTRVFEDCVCFINIFTHDDFSNSEAIKILHRNWPETIRPFKMNDIKAPPTERTDQDRSELRKAGMTNFITIDGNVYAPPRGLVTSGHSLKTVDNVSRFFERINNIRTYCLNNSDGVIQDIEKASNIKIDRLNLEISFSHPPFLEPFFIVETNSNVGILNSENLR